MRIKLREWNEWNAIADKSLNERQTSSKLVQQLTLQFQKELLIIEAAQRSSNHMESCVKAGQAFLKHTIHSMISDIQTSLTRAIQTRAAYQHELDALDVSLQLYPLAEKCKKALELLQLKIHDIGTKRRFFDFLEIF